MCSVVAVLGARLFLRLLLHRGLGGLRLRRRGVDLLQAAGVEGVDARPISGEVGEHDLARAFVAGGDGDVAGLAGAAHRLTFRHAERDAAEHRGGTAALGLQGVEPLARLDRDRHGRRRRAGRHRRAGEIAGDRAVGRLGGRRCGCGRRLGSRGRRGSRRRLGRGLGARGGRATAGGIDQILGGDRPAGGKRLGLGVGRLRPIGRLDERLGEHLVAAALEHVAGARTAADRRGQRCGENERQR